jgi:hypothetical protein
MVDALFLDADKTDDRDILVQGTRDALVTLRSAINEALSKQTGTADLADEEGFYRLVVVRRVGQ